MRELTMVTTNINGSKVPGKSLILGNFLHQENIDICVAVESHQSKQEVDPLALEGLGDFSLRSASCREVEEGRAKGEVAIFV